MGQNCGCNSRRTSQVGHVKSSKFGCNFMPESCTPIRYMPTGHPAHKILGQNNVSFFAAIVPTRLLTATVFPRQDWRAASLWEDGRSFLMLWRFDRNGIDVRG